VRADLPYLFGDEGKNHRARFPGLESPIENTRLRRNSCPTA